MSENANVEEKKEQKTMLDVEYGPMFNVECRNLLDNPKAMQFPGYEPFPIHRLANSSTDNGKGEEFILDTTRVRKEKTEILVILRYFEYVCIAKMNFSFLAEICKGDQKLVDAIGMMKHHLRNKLIREVRKTEEILDLHCEYTGKIKY